MKRRRFTIMAALAAVAAGVTAAVAWAAPAEIKHSYQMPVTSEFAMWPKVCDNKGSTIDIEGTLTFPGVGIDVRFENQDNNTDYSGPGKGKGWKKAEASSTASLEIYGLEVSLEKGSPSGVGGNPWIYVKLFNDAGQAISSELLVGRCVVGNSYRSGKYTGYVDADGSAVLQTLSCDQTGGPIVEVGGDHRRGGVSAEVIFTRKRGDFSPGHSSRAAMKLTPAIEARKGARLNGGDQVTGNPIISARFTDHQGSALQEYATLGRCNTLG